MRAANLISGLRVRGHKGFKQPLKIAAIVFTSLSLLGSIGSSQSRAAAARPQLHSTPSPPPLAAVINVNVIPAARAAATLRGLFPHARIRVDAHANAVVVVAPPDDIQQMRMVVQGIDVRNPQTPTTDVIQLHVLKPQVIVPRLRALYPNAQIEIASKTTLLVRASTQDVADIKSVLSSLDVAPPTVAPTTAPADAIRVTQANPRAVARALVREVPGLRASVAGPTIIIVGPQDSIERAKLLAQQLDAPAFDSKYTQVYRLHNVDATSVGDLIQRSYPAVKLSVDKDLNAISVYATAAVQQRIALAINELDAQQSTPGGSGGGAAYGSGNVDVVDLQSALPGQNGSPSDTAQSIAQAVTQSLSTMAPDLHVTVMSDRPELVLSGSPGSIRLARDLIAKLDQPQPLVVLDTEVLEVSENASRNLGIEVPPNQAFVGVSFGESSGDGSGYVYSGQGTWLPSMRLQKIIRTPLQLSAELNLLVQNGEARVLADPRITTVSGHAAHIQAGDQLNVLTQTGGGIGTPVTQQLQQFTTGVTLDITPIVGSNKIVSVALHPQVNSIVPSGGLLPVIATRDTSTVVQLRDNQTLVIGGLIQDSTQHTVSKIPLIGDIPLIGRIFRGDDTEHSRNELVIVVTPHVIAPGGTTPTNLMQPPPNAVLPIPTPAPLPTLRPDAELPPPVVPAPHAPPAPVNVSPIPQNAPSATPAPTPNAFASTDVFTFGSPPANTYASNTQTPQIFYAQFSPTVLKNGLTVQVSAITTTNVARVVVGYQGYWTSLTQTAPSRWQASFPINLTGLNATQSPINLQLNAYRTDGASASVQIPVSIVAQ